MSELQVHARTTEMVPVEVLVPYEKNARVHPESQIDKMVAIILDSGFTTPLIIDEDNCILAGHGRLLAARKLKMPEVPCVRVTGLSHAQKRAIRLSDNQLALLSTYDSDLLRVELTDLKGLGFDMSLTGFSSADLRSLFASAPGRTEADDVPLLPKTATSILGDLWLLGEHRLICGSSTDPTTVERVLGGAKPHLMCTDPPYGVNYDANWRNTVKRNPGLNAVPAGGGRAIGKIPNDDKSDWREVWALFPGEVAYVWCASLQSDVVIQSLESVGLQRRSLIVWNKYKSAIGRGHYQWKHEIAWYCVRKDGSSHWQGSRKESTVWDIEHRRSETGHSTQKPVEAMRKPIENNSAVGERVYDPFVGSGTTIIAAQTTGRICHAVELDPIYVDVALLRWQAFTGLEATHEDGRTFAQVQAERLEAGEALG